MEAIATSSPPIASEVEQLRAQLAKLEQTAARRARELTALHEISLGIARLTDFTILSRRHHAAPTPLGQDLLYRQRRADIALVLLDLSMPGLNGEETFHELRQINARVRVRLSSDYSHDEVAARFDGQGDVGFIQKPYDAEHLVREVKRDLAQPPAG